MKSFDDQTFDVILERMLNRIPDDLDKREGSVIYDAMAPAAIEVAQVYHLMTIMYRLIFGDASDGDMLELRAATFGVYRRQATSSVRLAQFTDTNSVPMDVPIGARFTVDGMTFGVIERISLGTYHVESETTGSTGNQVQGDMIPIEAIEGLGSARLGEVIVTGLDEQSDESLLEALQEKQSSQASSGNEADYKKWAKEIPGILDAQVYPEWAGPNTVKVVLVNTDKRSPSPYVINQVYEYIESVRPVGAIVTVTGVKERVLGITVNVTLREGFDEEVARNSSATNIEDYFRRVAGTDIVRYTAIGNAILDGEGVIDYTELRIDGTQGNITLEKDEVPVLGTLTIHT